MWLCRRWRLVMLHMARRRGASRESVSERQSRRGLHVNVAILRDWEVGAGADSLGIWRSSKIRSYRRFSAISTACIPSEAASTPVYPYSSRIRRHTATLTGESSTTSTLSGFSTARLRFILRFDCGVRFFSLSSGGGMMVLYRLLNLRGRARISSRLKCNRSISREISVALAT